MGLIYRKIGRIVGCLFSAASLLLPKKDRVRVIISDGSGRVLVVKNYFSRQQWALPGGGIKRGESFKRAAQREVFEELGLEIGGLRYLGRVETRETYRPFMVQVYTGAVDEAVEPKCNFEIMQWQWVDRSNLPKEYRFFRQKIV